MLARVLVLILTISHIVKPWTTADKKIDSTLASLTVRYFRKELYYIWKIKKHS